MTHPLKIPELSNSTSPTGCICLFCERFNGPSRLKGRSGTSGRRVGDSPGEKPTKAMVLSLRSVESGLQPGLLTTYQVPDRPFKYRDPTRTQRKQTRALVLHQALVSPSDSIYLYTKEARACHPIQIPNEVPSKLLLLSLVFGVSLIL